MKTLGRNLQAMAVTQPKLAERISWPVDSSHVIFGHNGNVQYRLNQSVYILNSSIEETGCCLGDLDDKKAFFVFGIGLGEQVELLLNLFPDNKIVAWEKDPWLVRLFLMQKDYSNAIFSGRLTISLGVDLIREIPNINDVTVLFHPFLKEVYCNEADLMRSGIGEKRVLMNTGGLFVDGVARALKDLGYVPFCLNLMGISIEEIDYSIVKLLPSVVFSVNYRNGLSELCRRFCLRLLCWEVDPAIDYVAPLSERDERAFVFVHRKKNRQEFLAAGFAHVEYLALATDTEIRRPVGLLEYEKERYVSSVSFVGSSLCEEARKYMDTLVMYYNEYGQGHSMEHKEKADPFRDLLDVQAQDYTRFCLTEMFNERFEDFIAYCRKRMGRNTNPVRLLAEVVASEKRRTYVSRLGRYRAKVWGDQGWKELDETGCRYMGPAGHRYEINKIYSGSLINLDVNRMYQPDIVTMRIFDIMGCGGFVLAEYSESLEELFALGEEVVCYRSVDELVEQVDYYLSHRNEAKQIAHNGMKAVRERHTIRERVEKMLSRVNLK